METVKEAVIQQPIVEQVKEFVTNRIKLAKYQAIEKGSSIAAEVVTDALMIISLLIAFIFASITLACYLAMVLKSNWAGFGCVTLFYLLIAVLIMISKKSFEKSIINSLIKKFIK